MGCQDYMRDDLFWGTGKIHEFAQLMPLIERIQTSNSKEISRELKKLLNFEHQLLQDILKQETETLLHINDKISSIKIHRFL